MTRERALPPSLPPPLPRRSRKLPMATFAQPTAMWEVSLGWSLGGRRRAPVPQRTEPARARGGGGGGRTRASGP